MSRNHWFVGYVLFTVYMYIGTYIAKRFLVRLYILTSPHCKQIKSVLPHLINYGALSRVAR